MDTPLPSFYVPSILFQSQSVCHVGLYYNKYETGTEESSVYVFGVYNTFSESTFSSAVLQVTS
jgi:hypothetical protein